MSSTTTALPQTSTTTWNIDPAHALAEFKVKHMMISNIKGRFSKLSGILSLDESGHHHSRVEVSAEAGSIHTGDDQRDAHLKSPDVLDLEKFPTLTFKSSGVRVLICQASHKSNNSHLCSDIVAHAWYSQANRV